jgi:hypothetical protein
MAFPERPVLPVTATEGELGALLTKLMLALTVAFFVVGVNVIETVWLAPGANVALEAPTVKFEPVDWMLLIVSVAVPLFVTVTVVVALEPRATPPKL